MISMGLDTVELVWKIEKHFKIKIPDKDAEQMVTVGDIQKKVYTYLSPTSHLEKAKIEADIIQIIADHAGLDITEVTSDKSITSDLGLD